MTCPCIQSTDIGSCAESISVGFIEDISTEVSVYIKNTSTGRITKFDTVSSLTGEVVIDTTDFNFGTSMNYEVTITAFGDPMNELIQFSAGDEVGTCVWFKVVEIEGAGWSLGASASVPSSSIVRYRHISSDAGWPSNYWTTGVRNQSALVSVTLEAPGEYQTGQKFLLKDETLLGSTYNIRLYGPWNDGDAYKEIVSDNGAIEFYSNGVDKFNVVNEF